MAYVTQGKVQIECNKNGGFYFYISPSQNYLANHSGKFLTIFISKNREKSLIYEKNRKFTAKKSIIDRIIQCAHEGKLIEIYISKNSKPGKPKSISGIKFPANI